MKTLQDIKKALDEIPAEVLEACGFGCGEGAEGEIRLVCDEEVEVNGKKLSFSEVFEEYPGLVEFDNLIENVKKASTILEGDGARSEEISDRYWEDRVSSKDFGKARGKK